MRPEHHRHHHRSDLIRLSAIAMTERGLQAEFSPNALQELAGFSSAAREDDSRIRNLTDLLWCSIDNDDSRDLDQLSFCEATGSKGIKVLVAIADVDALVKKGSAIDEHARINTTSVYTSARIFPMLPERLSTDLSSLNADQDRQALVTEMLFDAEGWLTDFTIYRAIVRNKAKLAYDAVSAWIEGKGEYPATAAKIPGMEDQLRQQDRVAQQLRARRYAEGSLEFETFQPRAVFDGEQVIDILQQEQNRARQLIEELMIATNGCNARFLAAHGGTSLRRVVRSPERWMRIMAVAQEYGETLPSQPDGKALAAFLSKQHRADPLRFPDLSLIIVKLMGRGEYVVEAHGGAAIGHFGLALRDYTHSTAPNRRFPDLITSRMLKAVLREETAPYTDSELTTLALHCTVQEDAAQKVERQMRKSEAALLLESRIGEQFDSIVTGNSDVGVWVRVLSPPTEGRLMANGTSLKIGERLRVKLLGVNVERGYIDFGLAPTSGRSQKH
jgi:exoribonuclease II